jgi:hypothetical protein
MSYQQERDRFVAQMASEGLPLHAIETLLRAATTMQRLAELACSSEAADRDRIPCPASKDPKAVCLCDLSDGEHTDIPRIRLQDWRTEGRAHAAIPPGWSINSQGDPRGYVLRVIPPSYAARNAGRDIHNLDAIGVPARDSRLRF